MLFHSNFSTEKTSVCRELAWDSDFFQKRIARAAPECVTEGALREIRNWCIANRIDCLYLLVAADDARMTRMLEAAHFHFVDIRTTLEIQIQELRATTVEFHVRKAVLSDVPALRAIAGMSHMDSRFYNDGRFPEERCRALYETWIEKSVHGCAQAVLVAELDGVPTGYVTCHLSSGVAEIGLLGIGAEARGKGLGNQLVWESLRWFKEQGAREVSVVTQGRNVRAQRVYQKAGFITRSIQLWYHWWPFIDRDGNPQEAPIVGN